MSSQIIAGRMATVRSIFEDVLMAANAEPDDKTLIKYLETQDVHFRSIAYEAAAMSRALSDIAAGSTLQLWTAFMQLTKPHAVQVHIGLGWALAQRQPQILPAISDLTPIMQARVLDGCGYYDGMFRSRSSVRDKIIPEEIKAHHLRAYDQGLGRSLWYTAKGDTAALLKLINGFTNERKPDLWRGAGIAVTYIGGCEEDVLNDLFNQAHPYEIQLASGAALLARARAHADTPNPDAELTCRLWCHMQANEAVQLMDDAEPKPGDYPEAYLDWMRGVERGIVDALG